MIEEKEKTALFTKTYILLIVTAFIGGFLMTFFTSTLPLFAENMTGSSIYAGLVTSVFSIAALISRPITGILCENHRHVPILIIGFAVMTCACFLYNWAGTIAILLVLRAFHGIGFGIKTTTSGVLVAENIPKSRFAEGIGLYNLYLPLTNALGPAFAYYIIDDGSVENFKVLFMIAAVIGCAAVIMSIFIKEKYIPNGKKIIENADLKTYDRKKLPPTILGFEKGVIWPALILAMMYIGQGAILSFIALYGIESGIGGIGNFFVVNAATLFIARFFFAKAANKTGYDAPSIIGLIIFAVGLIFIPLSHNILSLYAASALLGIAQGIVPMSLNAIILERCSKQRSGTAMAAYTSAMDIGVTIGSVVLGAILEITGYFIIFAVAALFSVVAAIVYYITLNGNKKVIEFE